jgi:hypothetical protein
MAKTSIWTFTRGEKAGTIDGLSLFFGALLGANLGTIGALPLYDYVTLIMLLAGMVVAIRIVSTSERRWYAFATLTVYVGLVVAILYVPAMRPQGLTEIDLHRLVATLAVWLGATMLVEFYPSSNPVEKPEP